MRPNQTELDLYWRDEVNSRIMGYMAEMSQTEIARRAGCTRAAINAVLSGKNSVSISMLFRIALALDIEPSFLMPSLDELKFMVNRYIKNEGLGDE